MEHSFLIIDGDKRQSALYDYLLANNHKCSLVKLSDTDFQKKLNYHSIIIFPTPFKDYKIINLLSPFHTLVGYGFEKPFLSQLTSKNIRYIDLSKNKYFVWNNGYLTAEATIGHIITTVPFSLAGSRCLICGYGNCGTHIAALISKLGGNITVYDKDDCTALKACASDFSALPALDFRISDFDIIINTVPYNIFTLDNILYINNNCYIFDIASSPYGFLELYRNTASKYSLLPGLPGKNMSKAAGELMGKTILNILNKKE